MNRKTNIRTVILLTLILGCAHAFSQTAEELLPKAIQLEEVNGELEQAIEVYQSIVDTYPDNRPAAAMAYLHMGRCYEKLGMEEARKAYQKVLENYPEQQKEVALARANLNRLLALQDTTPKHSFRKISIPTKPDNGVLSPDGENLAFTSQGAVWILPVKGKVQPDLAGEPHRITEPMEASNYGNTLAWSGDGQWIAFNATDDEKDAIYIVSSTGGEPKKISVNIIRSRGGSMRDHRLSLSHDGKLLAFSSSDLNLDKATLVKEEPRSIYTYSLEDGTITHLSEDFTEQPAISPDGKMIAYVKSIPVKGDTFLIEGCVVPVKGGSPLKVTEPIMNMCGPVW